MNVCLVLGGSGKLGSALVNELKTNSKYDEVISHSSEDCNLLFLDNYMKYIKKINPKTIYNCVGMVGGISFNEKFNYELLRMNSSVAINSTFIDKDINYYYISSSCVYPKNCKQPMKESDVFTGPLEETNKGYGYAKLLGMELCNLNPNWRSFIPCNLYSEEDDFIEYSHVLPSLIAKICRANQYDLNTVEIWGDGNARREHLHVKDCARAINIATNETTEKYVNIGCGIDYSILELAEKIKKIVKWNGEFVFNISKPSGMKQKLLNVSLLNNTSWKNYEYIKIDKGIELLIEGFTKQMHRQIERDKHIYRHVHDL